MDYRQFIGETLQEVSRIARKSFGSVTGQTKKEDNNQVLTETDLAVGKKIIEYIQARYPKHNIIDEETGAIDNKSPFTWVVDPIDGTSNFASAVPTFGIMIALLQEDTPVAGGIALPYFNEIYVALKGEGTLCNGNKIQVTSEKQLSSVLVSYGIDGHKEDLIKTKKECELLNNIILEIRNLRSSNSCFDVIQVAKGGYGAYLNQTQKIWDNVAEQIIIEEAGGVVTDFYGKPLTYENPIENRENTYTFCAGAREIHKHIQAIIHT